MSSVLDVAKYILECADEPMTAMKLQKLVYYCQAWSLVWDDEPLFDEEIEAWANGPVVPALYAYHRGYYKVTPDIFPGNPKNLTENQIDSINIVLKEYGDYKSYELVQMTHQEDPWRDMRIGLGPQDRGHRTITHNAMAEYYSSLIAE